MLTYPLLPLATAVVPVCVTVCVCVCCVRACSYLTDGAELCDEELCQNMVLTFQGGFYEAAVTTTQQYSAFQSAETRCGRALQRNKRRAAAGKEATGPVKPLRRAGDGDAEETVYTGIALIASGTVTVTSVDKKTEYTTGHMDYVYDAIALNPQYVADVYGPGDYTEVTAQTYKIKLVGDKQATY